MLKQANRLKSRGEFKRTLAGRRLCANDCFVVYGLMAQPNAALITPQSAPSPGLPVQPGVKPSEKSRRAEPRIGFIVSKKIHKRAVKRNRIKRRLREMLRLSLLGIRRDILSRYRTLVFIARTGSLTADHRHLQQRMDTCFRQL